MVTLTRLNQKEVMVNALQILTVESTPDTMVTFCNGDKLLVRETPDDVSQKVIQYFRHLGLREAAMGSAMMPIEARGT